jgi:hypothetical protein
MRAVARLRPGRPGLMLPAWLARGLVRGGLGRPLARGLRQLQRRRGA